MYVWTNKAKNARYPANHKLPSMNEQTFLEAWNIKFKKRLDKISLAGSPSRTITRFVFSDDKDNLYTAEGFACEREDKQIRQTVMLEFLKENGLESVLPAIRTVSGGYGVRLDNLFYQVRPFADADSFPDHSHWNQAVYGNIWSEFLLALRKVSKLPDFPKNSDRNFRFTRYLPILIKELKCRAPGIENRLEPVLESLRDFLEIEPCLPAFFAHGDFHPGNILMRNNQIKAVIDWEFSGMKTAGYDAALMIGCLGIDDSEWMTGPAARTMIGNLIRNRYMPPMALKYFPDLTIAIRLAWLAEWAELNESALLERELSFVELLSARKEKIFGDLATVR